MLTEQKVEHKLDSILNSSTSGFDKARALLRLKQELRATAATLAQLGFQFHDQGDHARRRRCFASAARMIELAEIAGAQARNCLSGNTRRLAFETSAIGQAWPHWTEPVPKHPWRPRELAR